MKDIVINCKKVYNSGNKYINSSQEIEKIKNNLDKISENIKNEWNGDDSQQFIESFNVHIFELNNLINFLNENGNILKKVSFLHNDADNEFKKNVERSDLNEQ